LKNPPLDIETFMLTPEIHQSSDKDDWSWVYSILASRGFPTPKLEQSTLLIAKRQGFLLGNLTQKDVSFLSYLYVENDSRKIGIGSSLISHFIELSRKQSANQIVIPGFTGNAPGYLQPGVNVETEKDALRLFRGHGFTEINKVFSMQRMLIDPIDIPIDKNWEVCHPDLDDVDSLSDAISHSVPGEWNSIFKERLMLNPTKILIAKNSECVGAYSTWQETRFGPIGVRPEFRGRGLGRLILGHSLESMKRQGESKAWFSWSDEENLNFYQNFGFEITQRYLRLRRDL
jgi:GNAT superfamily N-acetyltransferase